MKTKLSKNRGLSTVLTTVIILVASVVLGSGVVLYGASLFQGGTQQESMAVSGVKVWVHSTDANGIAIGAAKIRNTGDKVISVDKIQIRGTDVPFTQWFADTTVSSATFQQSLNHTGWAAASGTGSMAREVNTPVCAAGSDFISVDVAGPTESTTPGVCADPATGPIALTPGQSAIIYFKLTNGTLTSLDSGVSTTVNIFAGKTGSPESVTVQGKS